MRDMKMLTLAVASTAIGLTLMVMSVTRDVPLLRAVTAQHQQEAVMLQRSFAVTDGGGLVVDVADADVTISTGADGEAAIAVEVSARDLAWGREVFERMQFEATSEANVVTLKAIDPRIEGHEWRAHKGVHVVARVTIPSRFDVRVATGDGDVTLADVAGRVNLRTGDGDIVTGDVDGDVSVHTGDGDLVMGALRGPGVSVHSGDGDVRIAAITAERIEIATSDGDVQLRSVSGPLDARTGDGDVDVHLERAAPLSVRTGDGDVSITTAGPFGMTLDLQGESVDLPSGLTLQRSPSGRAATGSIHGGGPDIKVSTGDGAIRMRIGDG